MGQFFFRSAVTAWQSVAHLFSRSLQLLYAGQHQIGSSIVLLEQVVVPVSGRDTEAKEEAQYTASYRSDGATDGGATHNDGCGRRRGERCLCGLSSALDASFGVLDSSLGFTDGFLGGSTGGGGGFFDSGTGLRRCEAARRRKQGALSCAKGDHC